MMMENEIIMNDDELLLLNEEEERRTSWLGFGNKEWQVHKFGGTSVADAQCFQKVAKIVEERSNNNTMICVVVSAMGGKPKVTDLLLQSVQAAAQRDTDGVEDVLSMVLKKHEHCLQELMNQTPQKNNLRPLEDCENLLKIIRSDLNDIRDILKTVALMKWQAQRISELVSGYGELWSAQILATLLQRRSMNDNNINNINKYVYMDARRIITIDEEADGAVAWDISQQMLTKAVPILDMEEEESNHNDPQQSQQRQQQPHLVCTGYVASTTKGVATTLQRDGSDYSAAILGKLLQATQICIWTDVSGVLSADPRRVPHAHPVPEVSYNEAMELAYFGAKVIHPKTMQPAISCLPHQIPIYIKNTFEPNHPGTQIYTTSTTNTSPDKCVCAFSSIENMALINVEGSGLIGVQGVAKRLFGTLETLGVNVVLISQASSEHSITFATIEDDVDYAKQALSEEFAKELVQEKITNIDITRGCSIIAAVGDGMQYVCGVSGRFFSALGDAQINILAISQGCSERNISAVVKQNQSTRALRSLHAAFRLSHTTVRLAIIGMNDVGDSLLRLLEVQRPILRKTFDIDLQVCTVAMDSKDTDLWYLTEDDAGEEADSITMSALKAAAASTSTATNRGGGGGGGSNNSSGSSGSSTTSTIQFEHKAPDNIIKSVFTKDLAPLKDSLFRGDYSHHVVIDCSNDDEASIFHPQWLTEGVHVVTANHTGLSGSLKLRDSIHLAEKLYANMSAKYLREVTVGGGMPIITTLRTLLNSGDKIRRVDGIFSVAMSYIMFRVSPPPDSIKSVQFDQQIARGAFQGDIEPPKPNNNNNNNDEEGNKTNHNSSFTEPCSFSQAVEEAAALGLTEKNVLQDLNNEYTIGSMMCLATELGLNFGGQSRHDIAKHNEAFVSSLGDEVDEQVRQKVQAAAERGCVLRHVGSLNVSQHSPEIEVRVMEVPFNHVFATAPPSCEMVRFFTSRFQPYPLVIGGPAAGADCTSSALLAEVISLMSTKLGPKSGTLSRTDSSAFLS